MKRAVLYLAFLLPAASTHAQEKTYVTQIAEHRQHYKQEFIEDKRSPLKADDTANIRFFSPDENYRVKANVILTPEAEPFDMPTVSGKSRTSCMDTLPVSNMAKRSIPKPIPAVGGIPYSNARRKS